MKVLFISLSNIENFEDEGIYSDLLCEFISNDHKVTVISPDPTLKNKYLKITSLNNDVFKIKTPKITGIKSRVIKGINTILFPYLLWFRMNKLIDIESYDLVMYPTPPISIERIIARIKMKNKNIHTFLLLKDIFPQNAVDLEYFSQKSILYKFFRNQEIRLYKVSTTIGCMSQANKNYLLKNNAFISKKDVTIIPNSISSERVEGRLNIDIRKSRKMKYHLPLNKIIIVYAGNLGKPQSIDFLINNLGELSIHDTKVHFIFCGSGTESKKIKDFCDKNPQVGTYFGMLNKNQSDELISLSDYGLILLDSRFTIPNIPSRMLSYMKFGLPLIAFTDVNTDLKNIIQDNVLGFWEHSEGLTMSSVIRNISNVNDNEYQLYSKNCTRTIKDIYSSKVGYEYIDKRLNNVK